MQCHVGPPYRRQGGPRERCPVFPGKDIKADPALISPRWKANERGGKPFLFCCFPFEKGHNFTTDEVAALFPSPFSLSLSSSVKIRDDSCFLRSDPWVARINLENAEKPGLPQLSGVAQF